VLVSEVMLQQTQAPRVERHWRAFMDRFRTPVRFAAASPADAVRAWQGLGYNRRAIRLREAAVAIVERHDGTRAGEPPALEALPGSVRTRRAPSPRSASGSRGTARHEHPGASSDGSSTAMATRATGRSMPPRALQAAADALLGTG
jgi:hypothetical protein